MYRLELARTLSLSTRALIQGWASLGKIREEVTFNRSRSWQGQSGLMTGLRHRSRRSHPVILGVQILWQDEPRSQNPDFAFGGISDTRQAANLYRRWEMSWLARFPRFLSMLDLHASFRQDLGQKGAVRYDRRLVLVFSSQMNPGKIV